MRDTPIVNTFSHVKPGDTLWVDEGLQAFFSTATSALPTPPAAV
jgi:hypothetical protein